MSFLCLYSYCAHTGWTVKQIRCKSASSEDSHSLVFKFATALRPVFPLSACGCEGASRMQIHAELSSDRAAALCTFILPSQLVCSVCDTASCMRFHVDKAVSSFQPRGSIVLRPQDVRTLCIRKPLSAREVTHREPAGCWDASWDQWVAPSGSPDTGTRCI